jgi:magnesium transporter
MITILAVRGEGELMQDLSADELPRLLALSDVKLWVDIAGEMTQDDLRVVRDVFKFHPLAIEACFGEREHPKAESYDGYIYVITHGLTEGATAEATDTIELDAFLGKQFLVTYHAKPSRSVAAVRDMVQRGGDPLRRGPVLVFHTILEQQVERIEPVLDDTEERLAELEERVMRRPRPGDLAGLLAMRRNILRLRRWVTKERDVVLRLARNEFGLVGPHEAMLFRDVHDSLIRFTDLLENYRELTTSVQEAYLTMANNRLNETMKYLTLFTAVLMPLTVIAGIYGMNFEHMPELKWRHGYPMAIGVMLATAFGVIWFFRRKGWIGQERDAAPEAHDTMKGP